MTVHRQCCFRQHSTPTLPCACIMLPIDRSSLRSVCVQWCVVKAMECLQSVSMVMTCLLSTMRWKLPVRWRSVNVDRSSLKPWPIGQSVTLLTLLTCPTGQSKSLDSSLLYCCSCNARLLWARFALIDLKLLSLQDGIWSMPQNERRSTCKASCPGNYQRLSQQTSVAVNLYCVHHGAMWRCYSQHCKL